MVIRRVVVVLHTCPTTTYRIKMSPGNVVEIPEANLYVNDPGRLFSTDTQMFGRFNPGPALVLSVRPVDTTHGPEVAVELMDARGRIGWTDAKMFK